MFVTEVDLIDGVDWMFFLFLVNSGICMTAKEIEAQMPFESQNLFQIYKYISMSMSTSNSYSTDLNIWIE